MQTPSSTERSETPSGWRLNLLRISLLLLVLLVSFGLLGMREQIKSLAGWGYPGVFLIAMFSSATVLLPAPGMAIVYTMGHILNPFLVGLAAGFGSGLGETAGYLAGVSGRAVIERLDLYQRIKPYVEKYGGFAVFAFGVIPNPTFDVVGIAAGVLKMPFWVFLIAVVLSQIVKMTLVALAGAYSLNWFQGWLE